MCFGQGSAYLQLLADGKGPVRSDNLQHFDTAGSSATDRNQVEDLAEIDTAFAMDQLG